MVARSSQSALTSATRWVLPVGGVALFGMFLYFARSYTESLDVLLGTLSFPLVSAAILAGLGYYIATHDFPSSEMMTIFRWTVVGLVIMGGVVAWYQLLDRIHDHQVPTVISALATLAIGAGMGSLVGWYSLRAQHTVQEAAEARAREAHLEDQRETLALIDRTLRHHLLNALNVVDAHVELLREFVRPEGQAYLQTIENRSDEMVATIEEIREITETLLEQDAIEQVDLVRVARSELDSVAESYPDAEIEAGPMPEELRIPGNMLLSTALANLLHNAVQHNDAATPTVRLRIDTEGDMATIVVADNGPGIPLEQRERFFEMGERGTDSQGSGMGLFLARTVVERLGGEIEITDASDGTTVVVRLPTAEGGTG